MLSMAPFEWKTLTPLGELEYRLDEAGALIFRGDAPPITTARVRDGRGGFVDRALADLPLAWTPAADGDGWALRTSGDASTMATVGAQWGALVRAASEPLGLDERLVLATIAAEAGAALPDADGFVQAPRTEPGYPGRTSEKDPGDFARDADDWIHYAADRAHRTTHASHGLLQTLISTAVAVRPDLFDGVEPALYRTVLWRPENALACGVAYMASFPEAVRRDPLALRFQYGGGHIAPSGANRWGAVPLYDDLVPLLFAAYWNDDACLRAGACAAAPRIARPAASNAGAWLFAALACAALTITAAYGAALYGQRATARGSRVFA